MRMINSGIVNKPAAEVWELVGKNFADVSLWMVATPRSEPILQGVPIEGAPVVGRNSYLPAKFKGMYQQEIITSYSEKMKTVAFDVVLKNVSKLLPIKGYASTVTVEPVSDNSCRVTWDATVHLRTLGYIIPGIKKSMNAGFIRNVEEIKHYMETGKLHPRGGKKTRVKLTKV